MSREEELVALYTDPRPYKRHLGSLMGKKARRAAELFNTAEARGARASYVLHERIHEKKKFTVRALSVEGDLDEATLDELSRESSLLSSGRLFWEGQFAPQLPNAVGSDPDASDVHALSRLDRGIIVYVTMDEKRNSDFSYCVWARNGGDYFIVPVDEAWT